MRRTAENADTNYGRCSWRFATERCAFVARWYPGAPGSGGGLCWQHYGCTDRALGQRILEHSHRQVPTDFDHSAEGLLEITMHATLPERVNDLPAPYGMLEEPDRKRVDSAMLACREIAQAMSQRKPGVMPHVLAGAPTFASREPGEDDL